MRYSKKRKDRCGVVTTRTLAINQHNVVVLRSTVNFLAPLRPTRVSLGASGWGARRQLGA